MMHRTATGILILKPGCWGHQKPFPLLMAKLGFQHGRIFFSVNSTGLEAIGILLLLLHIQVEQEAESDTMPA